MRTAVTVEIEEDGPSVRVYLLSSKHPASALSPRIPPRGYRCLPLSRMVQVRPARWILPWRPLRGNGVEKLSMLRYQSTVSRLASALMLRAFVILEQQRGLRRHPSLPVPPDPRRIHYTSLDNASKIIGGQDLWLFDATTCNDREEYILGLRVGADALRTAWHVALEDAEALSGVLGDVDRIDLRRISRIGWHLASSLTSRSQPHAFVSSLSCPTTNEFDRLPMWAMYGANGSGVGLVMLDADLAKLASDAGCDYFPVVYEEDEQRAIFRFLTFAVNELLEWRQYQCWTKQVADIRSSIAAPTVYSAARIAALRMVLLVKHPAFSFENEVRLIWTAGATRQPIRKLQAEPGRIREYVSLADLSRSKSTLPFTELWFGPRARSSTKDRNLLREICATSVGIRESSIPYRGTDVEPSELATSIKRLRSFNERLRTAVRRESPPSSMVTHWEALEEQARKRDSHNAKLKS